MSAFSQGRYSSKSCALERADVLEARVTNVVADSPWCDAEHEPLCPSSVGFNSEEMRHAGNELADFLGVFLGGLANVQGYKRLTFEVTGTHWLRAARSIIACALRGALPVRVRVHRPVRHAD